jgi:hypothetical protein
MDNPEIGIERFPCHSSQEDARIGVTPIEVIQAAHEGSSGGKTASFVRGSD